MLTFNISVAEVLQTHVLTSRQEHHIQKLMACHQYQDTDLAALDELTVALAKGTVVVGGESLMVVSSTRVA
jgi:enoyl-CoA hydratase/carnithine racemase